MIEVVRGLVSEVEVDGLVRPIRSDGEAVSGVGLELGVAAGEEVLERVREMGELPVGSAVVTPGGRLTAAFLIHVVVQSPFEPVTARGVRTALVNAFRRASEWGMDSIALPPVGVGAGSLDAQEASMALTEALEEGGGSSPSRIVLVAQDDYQQEIFGRVAATRTPS